VDVGFVVHVHVFNVHRGSIAFRDHLKARHDTYQSSLWPGYIRKLEVGRHDSGLQLIEACESVRLSGSFLASIQARLPRCLFNAGLLKNDTSRARGQRIKKIAQ